MTHHSCIFSVRFVLFRILIHRRLHENWHKVCKSLHWCNPEMHAMSGHAWRHMPSSVFHDRGWKIEDWSRMPVRVRKKSFCPHQRFKFIRVLFWMQLCSNMLTGVSWEPRQNHGAHSCAVSKTWYPNLPDGFLGNWLHGPWLLKNRIYKIKRTALVMWCDDSMLHDILFTGEYFLNLYI